MSSDNSSSDDFAESTPARVEAMIMMPDENILTVTFEVPPSVTNIGDIITMAANHTCAMIRSSAISIKFV